MIEENGIEQMTNAVRAFVRRLADYPGWSEFQTKKFGYVLQEFRDDLYSDDEIFNEFKFSADIEKQRRVILLYLHLQGAAQDLRDVEFYFRRYPFRDLPVSHDDHFRYTCEMFFSRVYAFRERLKKYLTALNENLDDKTFDIGDFIKLFDKEFKQELKERNSIHHHKSFYSIDTDQVYLTGLMPSEKGWDREQRRIYRRVTKEWVARVRQRSDQIEAFLTAVAYASVTHCKFLAELSKEPNDSGDR
ncbi:MAG: hypothetical protein OXH94_03025 [Rhodospirillales bacterium]|nr:hypothetical protein [Rhodospirillales bacterium]